MRNLLLPASFAMCAVLSFASFVDAATQPTVSIDQKRADCQTNCRPNAIIFIHGLTGDETTWKAPNGETWPDLIIGDDTFKDYSIFVVTYKTTLFSGSDPSMEDIAIGLAAKIEDEILKPQHPQRIYFIAHSLGGLVTRRYLNHVLDRWNHQELSRYRLVFLMGTPSDGSKLADVLTRFSLSHLIPTLQPEQRNAFLGFLNDSLRDISEKHNSACLSLNFAAGIEGQPYRGVTIVDEESAKKGAKISMKFDDKDHLSLVKPSDRSDLVYKWVAQEMKECTSGGAICPPKPDGIPCPPYPTPWPAVNY